MRRSCARPVSTFPCYSLSFLSPSSLPCVPNKLYFVTLFAFCVFVTMMAICGRMCKRARRLLKACKRSGHQYDAPVAAKMASASQARVETRYGWRRGGRNGALVAACGGWRRRKHHNISLERVSTPRLTSLVTETHCWYMPPICVMLLCSWALAESPTDRSHQKEDFANTTQQITARAHSAHKT